MNYDKLLLATLSQDAFYSVNKSLVKNIGIVPALVLSHLIDKKKYFALVNQLDNEGGFFLSAKKIREEIKKENINVIEFELGIGEVARRSSFRVLEKKRLLKIQKKGHPARHYYYLNSEKIFNLISDSPTESHATSGVDVSRSSPTESHATYNKNKEQKQIIKTERENSLSEIRKEIALEEKELSFVNIGKLFEQELNSIRQKYIRDPRKEQYAINNFMLSNLEPTDVIELLRKLIDIKAAIHSKTLKDQYLLGCCYNIADLYSYRAKIENAYSIINAVSQYAYVNKSSGGFE